MQSGDRKSLSELMSALKGGLIVSCQASTGEPLAKPEHITAISLTVLRGGARALRLEGVENIRAVRAEVEVPIIGITKMDGKPLKGNTLRAWKLTVGPGGPKMARSKTSEISLAKI